MKEKRFFYLVAIIGFLFFNNLSAQVTIGSMEDPLQGSLLDFKQYNTSGSIENANKGVVFPRVSLENCTSLKPLSTANDAGEMQKYTGMVVYNLVEDNTLGLDFGLMSWNGEEWIPIFNKSGMGVFTVTADPIVTGTLVKNRTFTTTSNSIELPVNVTKTGTYSIVLRSNNGYYFSASGEFY
ncbi:MAG: hypothetical protein LBR13_05995, partial [Dysgonamonadaceae bacterium]|nr:hypothetical protein [Dysgonamonadaceae bacterium]